MSVPVLTAVTGVWEASLVAGLERLRGEVHVVRRCADLAELLSAALAGVASAAVVSGDLHRLDREALARLDGAGVAVVGLADPEDPQAGDRLLRLGVGHVIAADSPADEVAAAVSAAVGSMGRCGARVVRGHADPADALDGRSSGPAPPASRAGGSPGSAHRGEHGRIISVWGPTGAPGRTTVTITLAGELAATGAQTLVVDADTYGPSVAQALGLLDESGGIAGAVRAANHGALDVDRLARLSPSLSPTLRVLTGLPQPTRWPELRPSGLEVLWQQARDLARWTVVDCGFGLETDEEITFDTAAPRRHGATLSALAAADVVLAVGSADPVGLQRLVRGLAELADVLGPAVRPTVVITRVRAEAVGPDPARRITRALARYAGVEDPLLIPDDRAACDAAMLAGRMLGEVASGSPARRPLTALAAALDAE
jgi:MinD-like ATPase involved in chromosome partitioning or flagellar assembly